MVAARILARYFPASLSAALRSTAALKSVCVLMVLQCTRKMGGERYGEREGQRERGAIIAEGQEHYKGKLDGFEPHFPFLSSTQSSFE